MLAYIWINTNLGIMESYKIAVLLLLATTCVKAGLKTYKNITPGEFHQNFMLQVGIKEGSRLIMEL